MRSDDRDCRAVLRGPFKIQDTFVDERGVGRILWMLPKPFCCMLYMNDAGYLHGDQVRDMVRR